LAYVGITRARERLFLSRASSRARRGKLESRTASRFLEDLPAGAHRIHDAAASGSAVETATRSAEVLADLRARLAGAKQSA